jgi:putative sterol carrier protein
MRIIAGRLNGLQAYADGVLEVSGDMVLAQLQQTFFNADLSNAAIDVSTPSQLKKLLNGRTDREIEAGVIVTGIDKSLDMVFDGMVEHFLPKKAGKKRAVIQWDINTPEGERVYQFSVNRGDRDYSRGAGQKPDCRLVVNLPNFLRIASGELNGIIALAKGQLIVKTGLFLARAQQSWFDFTR